MMGIEPHLRQSTKLIADPVSLRFRGHGWHSRRIASNPFDREIMLHQNLVPYQGVEP